MRKNVELDDGDDDDDDDKENEKSGYGEEEGLVYRGVLLGF
jgi:hypothetical protein